MKDPWEHPDWYDLHDTTWTAGPEREPEHYRETVIAIPPLDRGDHIVDVGAGTGKLALLVGRAYPRVGHVTLIEPNPDKLARAEERLREALPASETRVVKAALGVDHALPKGQATLAMAGSVLMPTMELGGGTLEDGRQWLRAALADIRELLQPGAPFYDIETLAAPWARGGARDPVRRLDFRELVQELEQAGFLPVDCVYRFRDRVVLRAERPLSGTPAPKSREGLAPPRSA
jgi:FkbM family methyltransferase